MREKFPVVISTAANGKWKINLPALLEGRVAAGAANWDHLLTFYKFILQHFSDLHSKKCLMKVALPGKCSALRNPEEEQKHVASFGSRPSPPRLSPSACLGRLAKLSLKRFPGRHRDMLLANNHPELISSAHCISVTLS